MKLPTPSLILVFLMVASFSLSTTLQPLALNLRNRQQSDNLFKVVLGDAGRMFANHFFVKADIYFHSGYYPSMFQQGYQQADNSAHLKEDHDEAHETAAEHEHEKAMDFLGDPKDWIDRFGRHFYSTKHSHLDKPGEAREILPWLKLSAELDPQRIDTYTVAAYWLRLHMDKVNEAEEFLREGLRANPDSYEILFDLGSLYYENRHNSVIARNIWELALRRWYEQDDEEKEPSLQMLDRILANLAHVEEEQGNLREALAYLETQIEIAPEREPIQKSIDELKRKIADQAGPK